MTSSVLSGIRAIGQSIWRRLRQTRSLAAPPYAGIIHEAERCQADPERAAAFREANGLDRLAEAINAADADGHHELVDRGRAARRGLTDSE